MGLHQFILFLEYLKKLNQILFTNNYQLTYSGIAARLAKVPGVTSAIAGLGIFLNKNCGIFFQILYLFFLCI